MEVEDQRRPPKPKGQRRTAMDSDLIRAKIDRRIVEIQFPFPMPYTDDNGVAEGEVIFVDTYSVQFRINGKEMWVTKAFIVSVGT